MLLFQDPVERHIHSHSCSSVQLPVAQDAVAQWMFEVPMLMWNMFKPLPSIYADTKSGSSHSNRSSIYRRCSRSDCGVSTQSARTSAREKNICGACSTRVQVQRLQKFFPLFQRIFTSKQKRNVDLQESDQAFR